MGRQAMRSVNVVPLPRTSSPHLLHPSAPSAPYLPQILRLNGTQAKSAVQKLASYEFLNPTRITGISRCRLNFFDSGAGRIDASRAP